MGRWYYNRKATADESCRLEMSYLRKRGMLSGQTTGKISWTSSATGKTTTVLLLVDTTDEPFAILMYSVTDREGNKTDYKYAVSLVTTPCNLGGVRYWFGCPSCGGRAAVLSLRPVMFISGVGTVTTCHIAAVTVAHWSHSDITAES